MIACSVLSYIVLASGAVSIFSSTPFESIKSKSQFNKIAALASIFCLSVVLGNVSLKHLPVSFTQAIGATTPAFTAALAFILLGQREHWKVYLSLVPVVLGIVIASRAEPLFQLFGFIAAVSATSARAMKSVLQGHLLADANEKMSSLSLLMYMAPMACVALIPATMWYEPDALSVARKIGSVSGYFWVMLILNSCAAYLANLTNFLVTRYTSALTLQVLGNAKGVFTVATSIAYFRNPVNVWTVGGYFITVCGVAMYSQVKKGAMRLEYSPSLIGLDKEASSVSMYKLLTSKVPQDKEEETKEKDINV